MSYASLLRLGQRRLLLVLMVLVLPAPRPCLAEPAEPVRSIFETPLTEDNLDPAAFVEWVDGAERPLTFKDGPRHGIWTRSTAPEWDGIHFGDSRQPGTRHLRFGFQKAIPVGAILVRAGGQLAVLRPTATYPGRLAEEADWLPATRLQDNQVTRAEPGEEDYAIWVLPPGTTTRALRFTHEAKPTDASYAGWLGGAYVLADRLANIAVQAIVTTSTRQEAAARLNNGSNDRTWDTWDNGPQGAGQVISPEHPEWILLTWPQSVRLRGLNALWAGFGVADAQAYTGPVERHPREAAESDWQTIAHFDKIENQYPRGLGVNWLDFGQVVSTRAIRLRLTQVTTEAHPHLNGKTCNSKRVWLAELLALQPLGEADLKTALLPLPSAVLHPPIPVHFELAEPSYVTLVIEDKESHRVRNLIAETQFSAGPHTVWWDGLDDLLRDPEAARHGLYHIPGQLVKPGSYTVRGLSRKALDLRYEFAVYNPGNPPWPTADHTGAWLANHTPPSSTLFVPGNRAPGGKPLVFLGSYVSEGTDGLAWVDLDGHKQGGQNSVGGNWTGAPFLARDDGKNAVSETHAYAASAWEGELRLTALTRDGDKAIVHTKLEGNKENPLLAGLAVHDGLIVCSLPQQKQLLFVDARAAKVLGIGAVDDPRGLAFDAQGRLLVLAGKRLQRYPTLQPGQPLPVPQVLVVEGLSDPQQLTLDADGNIYVSDRGDSHQVKVFSPEGKPLRTIGHRGPPRAGPYDPEHLNNPHGLTIDSRNHLWVAETDFQPKRVSEWTLAGRLINAFYGPSEYGGGGTLDPRDRTRFYYHGMEFELDWKAGSNRLVQVFYRPDSNSFPGGLPETPFDVQGRRYFSNCYNSNPTNGASVAVLWLDRDGIAVPVAALGVANAWDLLKGDAFKSRWPAGVDLRGDYWSNQATFTWSDRNGDGQVQPEEVTFVKETAGGVTVMPDLSILVSRIGDSAMRFVPGQFTAQGVPLYDLSTGQALMAGAQVPTSSGGDQVLQSPDGWTVLTVAPKPFAPQSVGGGCKGVPLWSYPSLWPGLHASHEAPTPERLGELIGTTRLLGGLFTPRHSDAGPLWAINGNMGTVYLFTVDGLFVATLFKDGRQGHSWSMPSAQRGMSINDVTMHEENFWPTITQTADGKVYLVDGGRTSLVSLEGLESIRRLPARQLDVSAADLQQAQAYQVASEAQRHKSQGQETLKVVLRTTAPVVDGKLDDWAGAAWVDIDKRGVAANFDSNSKPYDVTAALAVAGDHLYAAFRTGDPNLLGNSGALPTAPFHTGGALDLMIGTDPKADPQRPHPVAGDVRLLVTLVKNKPKALLYRAVVPGTKEPIPFSSPWRTITIDRVDDVSDQVHLAAAEGNYEFSIPLATLGLAPRPGASIQGDIGILRGDGFQTLQRVYWSNKATGLTSDIPSEATLTPDLWARWMFQAGQ